MNKIFIQIKATIVIFFLLTNISYSYEKPTGNSHLPSWNNTKIKTDIINFVKSTTNPDNPDFIEVKDRIAVFDNDGVLWSEKPLYFQLLFVKDRIKELAAKNPEWKSKQPYKAIIENDTKAMSEFSHKDIMKLVLSVSKNQSVEAYKASVKEWLKKAKHPRFNRPFTDLVFQPMLELLSFLQDNGYKTYIVSGGGSDFIRVWSKQVYGIPEEQVIGSTTKSEFKYNNGKAYISKLPEIDFIDDNAGKPVAINKFIGKKPVFAVGNSDGDLQMLQWTHSNKAPNFKMYIHHTDEKREWAYDKDSSVGRLDKGLIEAKKHNWSIVDMKKDWRVIYPFELDR